LARLGVNIHTRLIERLNQTFHHTLSPLVRQSRSFCKTRTQMRRRVVFSNLLCPTPHEFENRDPAARAGK
jgi:hypothetical protein